MRLVRFFLFLGVVYVTAYGYLLLLPAAPLPENIRLGLIAASVTAYLFAVSVLLWRRGGPGRWMTFVATAFSYLSIVDMLILLRTKPEIYAETTAYELIVFFAIPMLACAWKISADEKTLRA